MKKKILVLLGILVFANFIIWSQAFAAHANGGSGKLKVAFLDIGQGDSIYVEAPNGKQMIVDGGPAQNLMTALPKVLPYGDKSIDVIMVTNPDADHYSGFIALLEKYDVGAVVLPGTHSATPTYAQFLNAAKNEGVPIAVATRGERIILDTAKNVSFDVLFPDRDVSTWESNNGSTVGKIVYGNTSVLMMGDATKLTEGILVAENDLSGTDILKVGHHGSKTSTGDPLLKDAKPSLAVISAGKNNRYGHPNKETTDRLDAYHIPYLVTMNEGTIEYDSDGEQMIRK